MSIGRKILFYGVLGIMALIALMPLFWMILTAVKQPGQGLKINFLPETEVSTLAYSINDLKDVPQTYAIFEYSDPTAQKVNVAGSFQGWNPSKTSLDNNNGIWTVQVELKPGEYEYKFVINGEWESGNNRKIKINPGRNSNIELTNASIIENNSIQFRYKNVKTDVASVLLSTGQKIELKKDNTGYFTGSAPLSEDIKNYKFIYNRSFKEAFLNLYTLDNFTEVWNNKDFPFGRFFFNSVLVSTLAALFTSIICTMAGYAFAKKDFFMRDKLFIGLLASMMIPGMIYMVPQFAIVSKLGWINTYWGMFVPHLGNVFGLFLIRQYIKTIPNSLFEAAKIDGASEFQIFKIIIIPLSLPIIATLFLLTFLGQWSNFLWQLIVNTPDSPYRTLPVGLALFKGQYAIMWTKIMAGACFSIVPIAILFLAAQRFFIEGMTGGAVKE